MKARSTRVLKSFVLAFAAAVLSAVGAFADEAPTSSSYAQEGLIAQWDGIDNTLTGGVRSHNSSASTWCDLTGNGNNLTKNGTVYWSDRALILNGAGAFIGSSAAIRDAILAQNGNAATIEIVTKPFAKTVRGASTCQVYFYVGNTADRVVAIEMRNDQGVTTDAFASFLYRDSESPANKSGASFLSRPGGANENAYVVITCTNEVAGLDIYGPLETVTEPDHFDRLPGCGDPSKIGPGTSAQVFVGINPGAATDTGAGGNDKLEGEIYAIRVYNRALTAAEIAQHRAIDQSRFFANPKPSIVPECSSSAQDGRKFSFNIHVNDLGAGENVLTLKLGKSSTSLGEKATLAVTAPGDYTLTCNDVSTIVNPGEKLYYGIELADGNGAVSATTAGKYVTAGDDNTYTWTGTGDGTTWESAANWKGNKTGWGIGWPKLANASVAFDANTTATVTFPESAITLTKLGVEKAGCDITFVNRAGKTAQDNLMTINSTLNLATGAGTTVTLDGVGIKTGATIGALASTDSRLILANAASATFGKTEVRGTSSIEVTEGSELYTAEFVVGADDREGCGTLVIDDALVQVKSNLYFGSNKAGKTQGGHIVFRGKNPRLQQNANSNIQPNADQSTAAGYEIPTFIFEVPEGGFAGVPITKIGSSQTKNFPTTSSAKRKWAFRIAETSPVLKTDFAGEIQLVQWTSTAYPIQTDWIVFDPMPADYAETCRLYFADDTGAETAVKPTRIYAHLEGEPDVAPSLGGVSVSETGYAYARFDVQLKSPGKEASVADVYLSVTPSAGGDAITAAAKGLAAGETASLRVIGLDAGTEYAWSVVASNALEGCRAKTGAFTTPTPETELTTTPIATLDAVTRNGKGDCADVTFSVPWSGNKAKTAEVTVSWTKAGSDKVSKTFADQLGNALTGEIGPFKPGTYSVTLHAACDGVESAETPAQELVIPGASTLGPVAVESAGVAGLTVTGAVAVAGYGTTTVKLVWGDTAGAMTHEKVIATFTPADEDLSFSGTTDGARPGSSVSWKVVTENSDGSETYVAESATAASAVPGAKRYVRRYGYKQDGTQAGNPQTESTLERMEGSFESYALAQKLVDSQQATISIRVKALEAGTDNPVSVFGLGAPRMYKDGAIYTDHKTDDPGFGFFFDPADGGKYGVHFGKASDDSYATVTAAQADGKWHLLTATYSGDGASGTLKLYVDGVLAGSAAAGAMTFGYQESSSDDASYSRAAHYFHLGYGGSTKSDKAALALLRGYLADAVVWDVARTDAQVAADAAKVLAFNGDEGMIAYWPLEESNQAAKLSSWGENFVNAYASLKVTAGSADFATTVEVDDFPVATPAFREGEVKLTLSDNNLKSTVEGAVQDSQSEVKAEVSRLRYEGYVPLCTFAPSAADGKFTFTTNSLLDVLRSDDQVFIRYVSTLTAGGETCSRTILKTGTKKQLTYTWTGGGDGETWSDPANWSADLSWANARGYPGSYSSRAVIGAAAKDRTIKATEEIDLFQLTFKDCGAVTIDLGGKSFFIGSAEDRFPYNMGLCNSGDNKIFVTNGAPVIANASLADYRYLAPTAYVTAPDQVFADATLVFKDCPDVRCNYMMAVGGGKYDRTDMGVTLDHANLLYRHWASGTGGGYAEHSFGDVRVVNGGSFRSYDGSVEKVIEMRLGRPGSTMYVGPGSKLLNGDVRLGEAGYYNPGAEGAPRDLSFIADGATLAFGHSVFTPTDTRTGGSLRMAYSANSQSGGIGGATGYAIALTNCTSTFYGSENIGIVGGDETKDTPVSNCTFTVSGGTFDAPRQTLYLQGGAGNVLRIDNGAAATVAALTGGCGSDFVLDGATLDVNGAVTLFAGNYAIWRDVEPNPRAIFTGSEPRLRIHNTSFKILNANHPGTLEFAPPAAGWTDPALEFAGTGDFKETGGYHIQVTAPAGGFNPNVIRIPLLRFGSSKTTYEAANFPENLAPGTFILPEGVEVRYDKDTYLLYAYIPAHAELASEIKSASVQCQDYTNLVFSGSLVRSLGVTTVKLLWGDDDEELTNETVLATIAKDAEDLTFAGELSFRLGTDIRWKVVSTVVNAGFLFEDATLPRDASTSPWQGSISKIDTKTLLGGVADLPVTIVPGSGENVLTFEYGFEDGVYEKSYELGRVRIGEATVIDNPVPLRTNVKVWYRATLTNTDPDGRGTSTVTKTGSWTPGLNSYVWHGGPDGDVSDPKNWVGYGDGETRYPTANNRDVVFIEFPEDGVRDFSVNIDADAVCQDLLATNVTLRLTGDGTKTLKMNFQTGHYGAAVLYGAAVTVGDGACVEMPGNYPQLRGPTTSTLTVANGGVLRLLSGNKALDDCCDAVGAPHRLSVEEGGKLLLLAGNGPGVTLSKEKYLLDLQPGSILAMTNNYNVINIGPNYSLRGVPMDVVWDGLKAIQTDGDPLKPNSEISVGSDSSLTICNMTNRVDGMPEIGFVWNKAATSNAFIHVSNAVLSVANAGLSSNGRYSGSFRVGFGYQSTYAGACDSEVLLEDVTLEGGGFGDFLYSRMNTNTLVTLRNVHGTFSGRWSGTAPSLSDGGALAFDYGYGNTFVLDDSRIYRRVPDLQTSVKLFNTKPGGSDALGRTTLIFRGAQPVLSAPVVFVGAGENEGWEAMGNEVRFEVPRAGWREAPVQAYDVKSDRTMRFCSNCFKVKVSFPDGLDDTVARIPIADTESGGYEEQYPNRPTFHVPENWILPDGWEVVSDKPAGEVYLRKTGVEDACASFATKSLLPERHWARATGELASLGRFGNARVLVRWGYGPEEMTQTFEAAAFTLDSDSLAFDARLPVEFPLCTTIWAQYELVSTDPSSGETYAHRGPMMCRELSSAVTTLSDYNFEQRVKGVLSPKFTVKNLGRGTTTVTLEIWPNGDEGASQTFELATFDEEFPGDTSKFVYHPGSLLVVPDKAGSKYSSRFIVTTVDGGTTTVRTYARNDVTVSTPDKGFYWNPQNGSTAWSDAANWIKIGSGMGGDYPNDTAAAVFITGFLSEPQSIVLSEDVTVDDIQFNDCANASLDLGGKTLTSVNAIEKTKPTGLFIKNSVIRFVNGRYNGVQWFSDRYDPGLGPTDVNKIVLDDGASVYFAGIGSQCNVDLNYSSGPMNLLIPTLIVNTNAVFETPTSIWNNNRSRLEIHGGVVRCGNSVNYSASPSKCCSSVEITDGGILESGGSYFVANQTRVPTLVADSTLVVSNAICLGYKQDVWTMTTNLSVLVTNSAVTVNRLKYDTWLGLRGYPTAGIDAVFADTTLDVTRIMIGKELQNNGALNNTPSAGARLTFKGAKTATTGRFEYVHGADNEVVFGTGLSNAFGSGEYTLTMTGTNNWFAVCDDACVVLSNETYKFDAEGGGVRFEGAAPQLKFAASDTKTAKFSVVSDKHETPAGFRWDLPVDRYASAAAVIDVDPAKVTLPSVLPLAVEDNPSCVTGVCKRARFPLLKFAQGDSPAIRNVMAASIEDATLTTGYAHTEKGGALEYREASATLYYIRPSNGIGMMVIVR